MITNYKNGRYDDKGLNSINNMGNMNLEHIERVKTSVPEINTVQMSNICYKNILKKIFLS